VLRKIFGPNRYEGAGEWRRRGALRTVLLTEYYSGDQTNRNTRGGACSTYGGDVRYLQGSGGET
jgi:hypothetical protein